MYLALSDEQEAFAHECRRLLEKEWSPARIRTTATPDGSGHDPLLHRRLAESGWLEIATAPPGDDEFGTLVELGIAYREAGRALVPTTLYSSVFAALLLRRCPVAAAQVLNGGIAGGEVLVAVAYVETTSPTTGLGSQCCTTVSASDDHWVLNGVKSFVMNAATADKILVTARVVHPDNPDVQTYAVVLVDANAEGVTQRQYCTFGHDSQSELTLTNVAVSREDMMIGPLAEESWHDVVGTVIDEVTALLCMEMVGGAERVLEDTARYVGQRIAFGRPIGSFQAVQHILANVAIDVAAARAASLYAVWAVAAKKDARKEVSIAKSWASRIYKDATLQAHQLFGGAGYVREADLHLWSQRAKAAEPLFGGRTYHLRRLASLLVDEGRP